MPMNEYGEIVRSGSSSNRSDNNPSNNNRTNINTRATDPFVSQVDRQFFEARKKNFNLITLAVGVPLYAIIGYLVAVNYLYEDMTGTTGAIIAGVVAAICTSVYNRKWAKKYEGFEYMVSILSTGIALLIAAAAAAVIGALLYIVAGLFGIVIVMIILGSSLDS